MKMYWPSLCSEIAVLFSFPVAQLPQPDEMSGSRWKPARRGTARRSQSILPHAGRTRSLQNSIAVTVLNSFPNVTDGGDGHGTAFSNPSSQAFGEIWPTSRWHISFLSPWRSPPHCPSSGRVVIAVGCRPDRVGSSFCWSFTTLWELMQDVLRQRLEKKKIECDYGLICTTCGYRSCKSCRMYLKI